MRTPVEVQIWRLSVLFLAGIAINILFQVYTAFRGVFRPRRFGRHFLDVVFSLAILGAAATIIFLVNWGELRLYVAISLILGFWFSSWLVGELIYAISYRSFNLARRGGRWTRTKVITPSSRFIARTGSKAKDWLLPPEPPEEGSSDGGAQDDTPHGNGPDNEPQDQEPHDGPPRIT